MNTLSFSASGAIIVYLIGHSDKGPLMKWAMFLPVLLSGLLASFLIHSGRLSANSAILVRSLNAQLGFNISPAVGLLRYLLFIFGLLHAFVAIGALVLFVFLL